MNTVEAQLTRARRYSFGLGVRADQAQARVINTDAIDDSSTTDYGQVH